MTSPIHCLLPNLGNDDLHLRWLPTQSPREIRHAKPMQPLHEILLHPHPPFLHHLILRPPIDRPSMRLALNLLESYLGEQPGKVVRDLEVDAKRFAAFHHETAPGHDGRVLRGGAVVASRGEVQVLHLDPPTGFEILVALLEKPFPVPDRDDEHASVDVIEWAFSSCRRIAARRAEAPRFLRVLDVESAVWWHVAWLDWGDIGADDDGRWVLVREVNRPYSSSRTDVKHALHVFGQGRAVQWDWAMLLREQE